MRGCALSFRRALTLIRERQLGDDLSCRRACFCNLFGFERDCADDGVPAAAVAFADRGDVVCARARTPRVRADGDFGALRAARNGDRVGRFGM